MDYKMLMGLVAASLTTFSMLPQVIKLYRTKLTRDISLAWSIMLFAGMVIWLMYGILLLDWPLIFANLIGGGFSFTVLFYKIKYKKYE